MQIVGEVLGALRVAADHVAEIAAQIVEAVRVVARGHRHRAIGHPATGGGACSGKAEHDENARDHGRSGCPDSASRVNAHAGFGSRLRLSAWSRARNDYACRMTRTNISSGGPWEPVVGYSRAVRVGRTCTSPAPRPPAPTAQVVAPGDAYAQTVQTLRNIERALHQAGATMADVVRTRIFVTDMSRWQEIGRAHGEFFANVRPAAAMVEVVRLIDPAMLVEIEADAYVGA